KEIESLFENTKKDLVKPKIEILEENIKLLEEKGYKIEKNASRNPTKNIKIDNESKLVQIYNSDRLVEDDIKIFGNRYKITYSKWRYESNEFPAVKLNNDNQIEINMNYPL